MNGDGRQKKIENQNEQSPRPYSFKPSRRFTSRLSLSRIASAAAVPLALLAFPGSGQAQSTPISVSRVQDPEPNQHITATDNLVLGPDFFGIGNIWLGMDDAFWLTPPIGFDYHNGHKGENGDSLVLENKKLKMFLTWKDHRLVSISIRSILHGMYERVPDTWVGHIAGTRLKLESQMDSILDFFPNAHILRPDFHNAFAGAYDHPSYFISFLLLSPRSGAFESATLSFHSFTGSTIEHIELYFPERETIAINPEQNIPLSERTNLVINPDSAGIGNIPLGVEDGDNIIMPEGFAYHNERKGGVGLRQEIINDRYGMVLSWSSSRLHDIVVFDGWQGEISGKGIKLGDPIERFLLAFPDAKKSENLPNTYEVRLQRNPLHPDETSLGMTLVAYCDANMKIIKMQLADDIYPDLYYEQYASLSATANLVFNPNSPGIGNIQLGMRDIDWLDFPEGFTYNGSTEITNKDFGITLEFDYSLASPLSGILVSDGWKGEIAGTGIRIGDSLEKFLQAYPDARNTRGLEHIYKTTIPIDSQYFSHWCRNVGLVVFFNADNNIERILLTFE